MFAYLYKYFSRYLFCQGFDKKTCFECNASFAHTCPAHATSYGWRSRQIMSKVDWSAHAFRTNTS